MPEIGTDELAALEATVVTAARTGDLSELNVIGFGEISIALGYPSTESKVVCKRMAIGTPREAEAYTRVLLDYLDQLDHIGIAAVPTQCVTTPAIGGEAMYLVQPLLDPETIGHRVLAATTPDAEHPLLIAIGNAISTVTNQMSIDAQVTNWSWDGSVATLIDVGTPFMWNERGELLPDIRPLVRLFPAPFRSYLIKELTGIVERWKDPAAVAADVVANLYREGLDDWAEPALVALNRTLAIRRPITETDARELYEEDRKSFPILKKLQSMERIWQTKVRRRSYDYLIAPTTYDV